MTTPAEIVVTPEMELETQRRNNLAKCPDPYFQIAGAKVLAYIDPADAEYGKIAIPDTAQNAPLVGTVIQVGGGYASDMLYTPDDFRKNCPYKPGDKILWSRFASTTIKLYVHPEWWSDEELETFGKIRREEKVDFLVLDMTNIIGLVTAPEKRVYEDGGD
jgi:co-chaperonin GroES (HSP10)